MKEQVNKLLELSKKADKIGDETKVALVATIAEKYEKCLESEILYLKA